MPKTKKTKAGSGLGRTLMKKINQKKDFEGTGDFMHLKTEDLKQKERQQFQSIIDQNPLDAFLQQATMSNQ
jgi:hypothetical protein